MGYEFDNSSQNISYGTHIELYQSQDMSVGMWVYYINVSAVNDKAIVAQHDSFPVVATETIISGGADGCGVRCEHQLGGSTRIGVNCIPGLTDPAFKLGFGSWRYFAFSRSYAARTYDSWSGTRSALLSGQSFTWNPGQEPLPFGTPGQNLGAWIIGLDMNNVIVGPMNYWDVYLTREQHLSMARCTLPQGVSDTHLLWWTKMLLGAADVGPNGFTNTFGGTPLPLYVPDEGCASFGNAEDYRLYNT